MLEAGDRESQRENWLTEEETQTGATGNVVTPLRDLELGDHVRSSMEEEKEEKETILWIEEEEELEEEAEPSVAGEALAICIVR